MSSLLIHTGSGPTQRISDAGAALGSEIQGNFSFVDTKVKSLTFLGGMQLDVKRLSGLGGYISLSGKLGAIHTAGLRVADRRSGDKRHSAKSAC